MSHNYRFHTREGGGRRGRREGGRKGGEEEGRERGREGGGGEERDWVWRYLCDMTGQLEGLTKS